MPKNSNLQLLLALSQTPLSVAIDAEGPHFQFYKSGVYSEPCQDNLCHGVLIVGYGEEDGVKYYVVKNSWGEGWGESGYIRLLRDEKDDAGWCGIRMQASYPEVSGGN